MTCYLETHYRDIQTCNRFEARPMGVRSIVRSTRNTWIYIIDHALRVCIFKGRVPSRDSIHGRWLSWLEVDDVLLMSLPPRILRLI